MLDEWKALFNKKSAVKSSQLSEAQCLAAAAVFGPLPEIKESCAKYDIKSIAGNLVGTVMADFTPVLNEIKSAMKAMSVELSELQAYCDKKEKEAAEKRYMTSRMGRALMADDTSWYNPQVLSGKKIAPVRQDWLDDMVHAAKPAAAVNPNVYGKHDLRMGKVNF